MERNPEYSHEFFLTAGESNACGRMPITLIAERVIEVATEHANELNIGYKDLITKNIGWVLSRLAIEMYRYPEINETYTLTTWIETYNKRFSERNFVMTDGAGEVLGYMRSLWVAIDMQSRTVADLSDFERDAFPIGSRECPICKVSRLTPLPDGSSEEDYTFRYCDIDFNRHVNTVRYLDLILNHWSLDHFDNNIINRLEICFHHECYFGEKVKLRIHTSDRKSRCEIVRDGTRTVGATITWLPNKKSRPAPTE